MNQSIEIPHRTRWSEVIEQVDAFEDISFDQLLVARLEKAAQSQSMMPSPISFYTPTFKRYQSSELQISNRQVWPAVSITGGDCKLQCDHCKAKILEPMIPARTPEDLWRVVNESLEQGAHGMLLTGGSNHRNEVEYGPYYSTIRRIKDDNPEFSIALHTALVDDDVAQSMEQAGIDAAMMDVIGAQETITQVYHLKRSVDDFEATLESLVKTKMKVVPHIVIGLHYGKLLGEWNALNMLQRHKPDAVVLVAVMPQYAPKKRPFVIPDPVAVGSFFFDSREALPEMPILLGCARPAGIAKIQIDAYAVMAGLAGLAHPAEGVVELAARLRRKVRIIPSCCSIAVGEELMHIESDHALEPELAELIALKQNKPGWFDRAAGSLSGIPIVMKD